VINWGLVPLSFSNLCPITAPATYAWGEWTKTSLKEVIGVCGGVASYRTEVQQPCQRAPKGCCTEGTRKLQTEVKRQPACTSSYDPSNLILRLDVPKDCGELHYFPVSPWAFSGRTADGRPWYSFAGRDIFGGADSTLSNAFQTWYLYFDKDCSGGVESGITPRWMITFDKPSLDSFTDLARDGVDCAAYVYSPVSSTMNGPPVNRKTDANECVDNQDFTFPFTLQGFLHVRTCLELKDGFHLQRAERGDDFCDVLFSEVLNFPTGTLNDDGMTDTQKDIQTLKAECPVACNLCGVDHLQFDPAMVNKVPPLVSDQIYAKCKNLASMNEVYVTQFEKDPYSAASAGWHTHGASQYLVLTAPATIGSKDSAEGLCNIMTNGDDELAKLVTFESKAEFEFVAELTAGAQHGYLRAPILQSCTEIGAHVIQTLEECIDAAMILGLHLRPTDSELWVGKEENSPHAVHEPENPAGCLYFGESDFVLRDRILLLNTDFRSSESVVRKNYNDNSPSSMNQICRATAQQSITKNDGNPLAVWVGKSHRWTPKQESVFATDQCFQLQLNALNSSGITMTDSLDLAEVKCTAPASHFVCELPVDVSWEVRNHSRYTYIQHPATWEDARATCRTLGGLGADLITADSVEDLEFLQQTNAENRGYNERTWIGCRADRSESFDVDVLPQFMWSSSGKSCQTSPEWGWEDSEAATGSLERIPFYDRCVVSEGGHKNEWKGTGCTHRYDYVCEAPVWKKFGESQYSYSTDLMSFVDATSFCKSMGPGSDVLSLESKEEESFVTNMIASHHAEFGDNRDKMWLDTESVWLGCTALKEMDGATDFSDTNEYEMKRFVGNAFKWNNSGLSCSTEEGYNDGVLGHLATQYTNWDNRGVDSVLNFCSRLVSSKVDNQTTNWRTVTCQTEEGCAVGTVCKAPSVRPEWYTFEASRYILLNTLASWKVAQQTCEAFGPGAQLLTIESASEDLFINTVVLLDHLEVWIGCNSIPDTPLDDPAATDDISVLFDFYNAGSTAADASCSPGSSGYTNWSPGYPVNVVLKWCALKDGWGSWSNFYCTERRQFICEQPLQEASAHTTTTVAAYPIDPPASPSPTGPSSTEPGAASGDGGTESAAAGAAIGVALLVAVLVAGMFIYRNQTRNVGNDADDGDDDVSLGCDGWTPASRQETRRIRMLEKELAAATFDRAHLTFLANYSRRLFSTVSSAEEHRAELKHLELPRKSIRRSSVLGRGNYGLVRLATLEHGPTPGQPSSTRPDDKDGNNSRPNETNKTLGALTLPGGKREVAVKSRLPAETDATVDEALFIEALVLHSVHHPHILGLVGFCTDTLPFLVVTELMVNGDLKQYLRACRPTVVDRSVVLTLLDAILIMERMAKALAHLESVQVIHRDARC
jgi:hypothetical protein